MAEVVIVSIDVTAIARIGSNGFDRSGSREAINARSPLVLGVHVSSMLQQELNHG